jgi:(p)ppGpp synthase/HD superfamily hydrolase
MPDVSDLLRLIGPAVAMDGQQQLARAIAVASAAHSGQIDKSGRAYILHPLRVMQRCAPHGDAAQAVAALHDVVEDTWIALDDLRRLGFSEEVVTAVDAISQRQGRETYFEYIRRCAEHPLAALVKLADLEDNSDPLRSFGGDFDGLVRRYAKAREIIEQKLGEAG